LKYGFILHIITFLEKKKRIKTQAALTVKNLAVLLLDGKKESSASGTGNFTFGSP
jgi:hypothetical protein